MKSLGFLLKFIVLSSILLSVAGLTHAQATRTWVASPPTGDDSAPCSRTAPCATFAGAMSKTHEGGEIDVIDPGSYGIFTVTKAITIDGGTGAGWAGMIANGAGVTNGITISVTSGTHADDAKVILRNLNLNGAKQAGNGGSVAINVVKVHELHLENINIEDFSSVGIDIDTADNINVFMRHVTLSHCVTGVRMNTASGFFANAYLDDVSIQGSNNGLNTVADAFAVIRNSYFSENRGSSLGAVKVSSGCFVSLENSVFAGNNFAVNVDAGGTANISNNSFYGNVTALNGAGTIATATNSNKFALNGSDGATNATITLK